jgi:hypothetical protein
MALSRGWLGSGVFAVGLTLAIWAVVTIRRAGTRVEANEPTTTIVAIEPGSVSAYGNALTCIMWTQPGLGLAACTPNCPDGQAEAPACNSNHGTGRRQGADNRRTGGQVE